MTIRQAKPSDARAIAEVQVASWKAAYRGLLPDRLLDRLSVESSERRWRGRLVDHAGRALVYERNSCIIGFISFGPSRDDDADQGRVGEIYALYLELSEWRKSYGSALLDEATEALCERGFSELTLWVLHNNQQGIRFYEAAGFERDGAFKVETAANEIALHEIRYRLTI